MNREIKFRVWDTKHDCMYWPEKFSEKIVLQIGGVIGLFNGSTYDTISPDRFIIEQYTGLKDKNGKEIYEGDIVQWQSKFVHTDIPTPHKTGVVTYAHDGCRYYVKYRFDGVNRNKELNATSGGEEYRNDAFEIIGNIHSNPELLKTNQ